MNSINREFDLSRGMVSKALLKAAGVELQHDCNSTLKGRQIAFPEVVVTGGYNLSAKKIFHGVLPRYKSESSMQVQHTTYLSSLFFVICIPILVKYYLVNKIKISG